MDIEPEVTVFAVLDPVFVPVLDPLVPVEEPLVLDADPDVAVVDGETLLELRIN